MLPSLAQCALPTCGTVSIKQLGQPVGRRQAAIAAGLLGAGAATPRHWAASGSSPPADATTAWRARLPGRRADPPETKRRRSPSQSSPCSAARDDLPVAATAPLTRPAAITPLSNPTPHSAEPINAAPVAPSLKPEPAQRLPEFAGMTVAAPTAPQRCLQGRERQPLALHVERDRGKQPREATFRRRARARRLLLPRAGRQVRLLGSREEAPARLGSCPIFSDVGTRRPEPLHDAEAAEQIHSSYQRRSEVRASPAGAHRIGCTRT